MGSGTLPGTVTATLGPKSFRHYLLGQLVWIALSVVGLLVLQKLTAYYLLISWLIGALVVDDLTTPPGSPSRWRRRIRILVVLGYVLFLVLAIRMVIVLIASNL